MELWLELAPRKKRATDAVTSAALVYSPSPDASHERRESISMKKKQPEEKSNHIGRLLELVPSPTESDDKVMRNFLTIVVALIAIVAVAGLVWSIIASVF
jgi:hypothetical protein